MERVEIKEASYTSPGGKGEALHSSLDTPFNLELAHELLATYGSPLYVYQGDRLRDTIQYITQAIAYPRTQFHFASVTNATIAFTQVIDIVLATAQQLPNWEYLDFGGGFGYPYRRNGAAFNWEEFGAELTKQIGRLERDIDLVIEPGRAAIAGCATLLAQVVSVKWQQQKQIVGVNTTVANLSVPSVHGGYREIVTWVGAHSDAPLHPTDVCGNTTYSRDYLGRNCQLPALEIGDIIAILDVGAYGYAMSSHFLHRPRPAEVLLENDTPRLIRKREDYSILLNKQVFDANK